MGMKVNGSTGLTFPDSTTMSTGAQAVRAWVNFNGTGTVAIRASYNVTSITDNGTGDYTLNFTNAMVDANYCISGSAGNGSTNLAAICQPFTLSAPSTSSVRIQTPFVNGSLGDTPSTNVAIFD